MLAAVPLLLLALLFLIGGERVAGIVLLALLTFAAASRTRIVERNIAGYHARTTSLLLAARYVALLAIYMVIVGLLFVMSRDHWTDDTRGLVAVYASAGLAFYLARDIWRYGKESLNWLIGSEAEEGVAAVVDPLRDEGWTVTHNLVRERGGNLDHLAVYEKTAFAIETKSGKYRATDRGQAISNAVWAKEQFGLRWVTAVLCVASDPPESPREERHGNSTVWVVGVAGLTGWLRANRDRPPSWR
jgi:hypothetical protein